MNYTAQTLPYQQTGFFSRIISDYLNAHSNLRSFYEHAVSPEGMDAAIKERDLFPTDRITLVKALEEQYAGLSTPDAVLRNLSALASRNTYTITTAHQPAIFTGHLYFIYKILHVIELAGMMSARHKTLHFVPVFYMGSEDADLDELGHIYLDKEKISWETTQTGAVGRMNTQGLEKIIDRIEGEFSSHAYGPELIQLLKEAYIGAENVQQATLKLLNKLFGRFGLIVLIPDHRLLKSVMRGVFKDDLTNHTPFKITQYEVNRLSEYYPVQANPREINLFYLKGDIRERIEWKDDNYSVHHTDIRFTPAEMEHELANFPERFSPNVILRGLLQETILPNIAFVGGGGETAYWLELKALFRHYRVPFPVLVLRNSFLLIRKNWRLKMEKSGLTAENVFKPEEELVEAYVREHSDRRLDLGAEISEIKGLYASMKMIAGTVEKTLEQHVEKLEAQAIQKLEELEKKILRAEKKNHEDSRRKIHEIREALFPLNSLQERIENFIPWYAEYGPELIDKLYHESPGLSQVFTVLEEIK